MEWTTWRRALVACAAASLVAAAVVLTIGDANPLRVRSVEGEAASVNPVADATELKAAVRNRHTQLTQRSEGSTAKSHPALFITTLLAGLLIAAAARWFTQRAPLGCPTLERRRHSLSLRGPPLLQLA